MADAKENLKRFACRVEAFFDRLLGAWKRRLARHRAVQIVAYRGYGTSECVRIMGRVLVDKAVAKARVTDSAWDNLLRMVKRFESDELPGVPVVASVRGATASTISDEEGYYRAILRPTPPLNDRKMWHEIGLSVMPPGGNRVHATGCILVPPRQSTFGIISDIDDTIIESGAASLPRLVRNTLLKNARTRLPFPNIEHFYTTLQTGHGQGVQNPVFYVSNSPWNLYDFLVDFMILNHVPPGPILLRDFGLDAEKFIKDDFHKIDRISEILNTYPDLPFVLIGDSGERDPEIYAQVVERFPGRILAVYIRDVTSEPRDGEVRHIATTVSSMGVDMCLVTDMAAAASHAAQRGLIKNNPEPIHEGDANRKINPLGK